MKIRDMIERLSRLDLDMDVNDLRETLTTSRAKSDELVTSIDTDTNSWDEFSAMLTKSAVLPILHEIRDLMLMPASARGWLKPAEMAKKVAEQVEINEAKCQERIRELQDDAYNARLEAEELHKSTTCKMIQQHNEAIAEMQTFHEAGFASLKADYEYKVEQFRDLLNERDKAMDKVPSKQADAVSEVLVEAADRVEAMAQMRLTRLVKRKSFFRDKDLDQTMLRVEADGIMCSAKRLRQMATEAKKQGVWPIKFSAGEENTPEAREALARILTPIHDTDLDAEPTVEIEAEAD